MSKEEILELINAGFAPELIELEFNVPLEKINKYIKQEQKRQEDEKARKLIEEQKEETKRLEAQRKAEEAKKLAKQKEEQAKRTAQTSRINQSATQNTVSKKKRSNINTLDVLRKNYRQLMAFAPETSTQSKVILPNEIEQEKVNNTINTLNSTLSNIMKLTPAERREKRLALGDMLTQLKEISKMPKTIEQLTQIRKIFQSSVLENLAISHDDKINLKLMKARRNLAEELATVIEQNANQTSDLNELIELSKKIPILEHSSAQLYVSSIKSKIDSRINQLRTAQTMYNIRNNVSHEIESVVTSIANNTFDLETAKEAISKEAQRRVDAAPKTPFALTKERQIKQIEIQIRTLLSEQGNKYPITNPGSAMNNLMTLFSERDKESSFAKVIENLVSQGKYDEAKDLCNKYIVRRSFDTEESSMSKQARLLHKSATLTQIGNMVIEQIKKPSNPEEDEIFMSLLEERMNKEKIAPGQIIIGATPSGGKKLTLNDIWYTNTRLQK